jgi:hydrogenase maturation factor
VQIAGVRSQLQVHVFVSRVSLGPQNVVHCGFDLQEQEVASKSSVRALQLAAESSHLQEQVLVSML